MSMLAIAFPPSVHSVSLYFAGKIRDRTVPLKLLSPSQAEKTGLVRFRYISLAYRGRSCLTRFVTRSSTGRVIDSGEPMPCRKGPGSRIR
jgi:hypothetical protein